MSVTIPATGAGTVAPLVATESNAVGHFQLVKLTDGAVGSINTIGNSQYPMFVQQLGVQTILGSVSISGGSWVGSVVVQGDVGHGSVDLGYPVKMGGYAVTSAFPTAVDCGDRVNAMFDRHGRQIVIPVAPLTIRQTRWGSYTGPLSGTVVWSAGVNNRIVITDWTISAGSLTTAYVAVYFASSGPTKQYVSGSGTAIFHGELAPTSMSKPGATMPYGYPDVSDPNDSLRISVNAAAQIYLRVGGFETP